jgi:hypothetical protein
MVGDGEARETAKRKKVKSGLDNNGLFIDGTAEHPSLPVTCDLGLDRCRVPLV